MYKSLRDWLDVLEKEGLLKHITAEVDWNLELSAIVRRNSDQQGPALLFENIKDHQNSACRKFLALYLRSINICKNFNTIPQDN